MRGSAFSQGPGSRSTPVPSDVVTIRGLTLNGLGGSDGIDFNSGASLYVQESVFKNLVNYAILAGTSTDANMVVEDSLFTRMGSSAVTLSPSGGTFRGTIEHSRFAGSDAGVAVYAGNLVVRDSVASNNVEGFGAVNSGSQLDVENSLAT